MQRPRSREGGGRAPSGDRRYVVKSGNPFRIVFLYETKLQSELAPRPKKSTAISCLQQAWVELQRFKICHASFQHQLCYCIDIKKCFLGRRLKKLNKKSAPSREVQTKLFPTHHQLSSPASCTMLLSPSTAANFGR